MKGAGIREGAREETEPKAVKLRQTRGEAEKENQTLVRSRR